MSTQLRHIAQAPAHAPVRSKFFLAVAAMDPSTNSISGDVPSLAVTLAAVANESIMTTTTFNDATAPIAAAIPVNSLLRDLGRQITIVDAEGAHLYKYRNVQLVNGTGAGAEGVPANYNTTASNLYVLVWAANGTAPAVVRTG